MNERFRELAKQQAGAILMDLVMPDSGMPERVKWNVGITTEHLEKFAELIVCECADLYNHEDVLAPIGMSARGEAHQHGWIEGTKTYRDTILEHFGVKE